MMKAQYNREDDVLMLRLSQGQIDYAEETEGVIVHFTKDNHPVLLEVLDASDWLSRLNRLTARAKSGLEIAV
ncbi:MAG: DUF2283 domain-containing protein [Candidatus Sumerlaeota bacterium]|nr:DUF2283 domain-containing protein [Candidatus Sumerlaeota bacterium]